MAEYEDLIQLGEAVMAAKRVAAAQDYYVQAVEEYRAIDPLGYEEYAAEMAGQNAPPPEPPAEPPAEPTQRPTLGSAMGDFMAELRAKRGA